MILLGLFAQNALKKSLESIAIVVVLRKHSELLFANSLSLKCFIISMSVTLNEMDMLSC